MDEKKGGTIFGSENWTKEDYERMTRTDDGILKMCEVLGISSDREAQEYYHARAKAMNAEYQAKASKSSILDRMAESARKANKAAKEAEREVGD